MKSDDMEKLKVGDVVQHSVTLKYFRVTANKEGFVSLEPVIGQDDLDEYTVVEKPKPERPTRVAHDVGESKR